MYTPPDQSSTMSYPTYAGGQAPFSLTGKNKKKQRQQYTGYLAGKVGEGAGRVAGYDQGLSKYFNDPTSGANDYLPFFQKAAGAASAPALRDFTQTQTTLGANIASRFGGNASSEESRQLTNSGDLFSRNLTEALARIGPQAITAGQTRGSQLLSARGQAGGEQQDFMQMLMEMLNQKEEAPWWQKALGTGAGIALNHFLPVKK